MELRGLCFEIHNSVRFNKLVKDNQA